MSIQSNWWAIKTVVKEFFSGWYTAGVPRLPRPPRLEPLPATNDPTTFTSDPTTPRFNAAVASWIAFVERQHYVHPNVSATYPMRFTYTITRVNNQ